MQILDLELAGARVHRDRIVARETRVAERGWVPLAGLEALERQIAERVGTQVLPDLVGGLERSDQLSHARRVDPIEAGMGDRRRADAEMHLARAVLAQHP